MVTWDRPREEARAWSDAIVPTDRFDDSHRSIDVALAAFSAPADDVVALGERLGALIEAGADRLPLPGSGRTLDRWRALARVAAQDIALVKLFEGHTDAVAILAELGEPISKGRWGTWAAEPRDARVSVCTRDGETTLHGRKAWCSGATVLTHALLTAWDESGSQRLVALALDAPGVAVTRDGWNAVGMAATASVDVHLEGAPARLVGGPNAYLARPGFWHGGAGIAACWQGGAAAIASRVHDALSRTGSRADPHALAHLGAMDAALASTATLLREAARTIDQRPRDDAHTLALRVRLAAEACVDTVLAHAGRALGAGPLCKDAALARQMADLPVFVRQSHAERDMASLGALLAAAPRAPADWFA